MAAHSPNYLAQKINSLLDGRRFFEHWQDKFREPQTVAGTVKCHCPFHLGGGFRSFMIDLDRKTFRCTFRQCKAAFNGTLPELHALLVDKPLPDALLDLISTFKLELSGQLHLDLADTLAEQARELLRGGGKLDAAENSAVLALKENPTSMSIRLLLAEICEQRNRPGDAVAYYVSVAQESIERKDWGRAEEVLEHLQALRPDKAEYVEQKALVAAAKGDRARAVDCYLELAGRSDTDALERFEWLKKARSLDPNRIETLRLLADVAESTGDPGAAQLWRSLVERYLATNQSEEALDALEHVAKLQGPERGDLDEQRAALLLSLGRRDEAAEIFRSLADLAREKDSSERTEYYLRRVCEAKPDDLDALWQLMLLLEKEERTDDATVLADQILSAGGPEATAEQQVETLRRLKKWHPSNVIYREQLVDRLVQSGETDSALDELQELAELCFERNLTSEALQYFQVFRKSAADQPRRRLEIAQALARLKCRREAVEEFESIARQSLQEEPALAEEACRLGLAVDDSNVSLHEILLQVYLADRPDEASEQCRKLVELHKRRGSAKEVLGVLEQLKASWPDRVEPRVLLAENSVETGNPERAIAELDELTDRALSTEQLESVLRCADAVAQRYGDRFDLLQMLTRLHRERGDSDALVETLLRMAAAQSAAGANEAAEATYLEIFAIRPEETRALLGHAELVRTERGFAAAKPLYQRYVERLLSAGRTEDAVRVYLRCIDWAPEDVDFRRALGALLAEQGDFAGARAQWEAAAETYLTVHDNPASAVQCYEAILSRSPDDVEARIRAARLYAKAGDPNASQQAYRAAADALGDRHDIDGQIELYREALDVLPKNGELIRGLAVALQACGRKEEAVAALEELLVLEEKSGRRQEAVATLRSLVALTSDRLDLVERLAQLLAESGDLTAAAEQFARLAEELARRREYDRAIAARLWIKEHQPTDTDNRQALVVLYRKRNDGERLRAELTELAAVWRERKSLDEALDVMQDRVSLDPDDPEIRLALAQLREEAGQSDAAAEDFSHAGQAYQKNGDIDRARQMFERALELCPGSVKYRRRLVGLSIEERDTPRAAAELRELAESLFDSGDRKEAMNCCRQMLKLGRKDPDIHLRVARLFAKHDCPDEARKTYDRAILRCERRKDDIKTLEVLEHALADFPDAEDLWQKRIDVESRIGEAESAVSSALSLARLLLERQARPDRIESVFEKALELGEPTAELLTSMAQFYTDLGRVDDATRALQRLAQIRESAGDSDGAIEALKRVYSFRPSDCETLGALVRLSEEVGDYEAEHEFRTRLADQFVSQGRWEEARREYEALSSDPGYEEKTIPALIRIAKETGDREAEKTYTQKWTEYLERQDRADEALIACEEVLEQSPDDTDTLWKMAELYGRRGDGERQVATLIRLASLCEKAGELERAAAARLQVRTLDPENHDNLVALAEIYQRSDRSADAVEVWREVYEAALRRSDLPRSASIARRILEIDETQDDIRAKLAETLAELDRTDEAAEQFSTLGRRLAGNRPEEAVAAYRHALQYQSYRAADREALAGLLAAQEDLGAAVSEYFQAAQDFAKANEPAHGIACLQSILALEPNHRLARELLIQMRLEAGEAGQAVGEAVALADRALLDGRKDDAERILMKVADAGPDKAALACERLADLYMSEGRMNEALGRLGPLVEKSRRESNHPKLIEYLEKVCDLIPIDHEHRIELVELNLQQGNLRKALEHFRRLLPVLARIKLVSESDRVGQLLLGAAGEDWEIKQEVARAYAQAQMRDLAAMTYLDMATTARGEKDYERVLDFASSALGLNPESTTARELLLEVNLALGQQREAFQHAGELSRLYDDQDQPDKALAVARKMIDLQPDDPSGYQRLSELLEKHGSEDDLCDLLGRLADLYLKLGNTAKAVETLGRHLVIRPDAMSVRRRYVELAASIGEVAGLVDEYLALIASATEAGDPDQAAELFERALEVEPGNLELRERWVDFLFVQERYDQANQALLDLADRLSEADKIKKATRLVAAAAERFPDKPGLAGKLGDLYLLQNAKGRAIEQYKQAARGFLEANNRPAAHAIIERILEIDPLDVSTRSVLVESLFAAQQIDLALQHCRILADQYAERNLLDLAEAEYRRIVAHSPDDLGAWQCVLDIVERMGGEREHISDYLLVAESMARRGLLDEAVQYYRKVIQLDPDDIEARRAYIDVYLQVGMESNLVPDYLELGERLAGRGLVDEAVEIYQRVLMVDPQNADAQRQIRRLRPDLSEDSTVQLQAQTREVEAAADKQSATGTGAKLTDEKSLREAIENYRGILKSNPENVMVRARVADLLFQLGEAEQAVEEWDTASQQFLERGELQSVIRLCEKILKVDPARPGIRDRLSRANLQKHSMEAIESAIESLEDEDFKFEDNSKDTK